MSKIQDALEKIKAEKAQGKSSASYTESNSIPGEGINFTRSREAVVSDISGMYQPDELSDEQKENNRIISTGMSDKKIFNAFRDIRTTVIQKANKPSPIIMVTAVACNSGSSFVAVNLAASIAMDEASTSLLVDCNLSNPCSNNLPATEKIVGLKEYLSDQSKSIQDIILPTGIPRMRVIAVGSSNVKMTEFFTTNRLNNLFDDIKKRYDRRYIIIDAPPIMENADARILSQVCDYVILVVPYNQVTKNQVLGAARMIGKDKLLGTIFNNEPRLPGFMSKYTV